MNRRDYIATDSQATTSLDFVFGRDFLREGTLRANLVTQSPSRDEAQRFLRVSRAINDELDDVFRKLARDESGPEK